VRRVREKRPAFLLSFTPLWANRLCRTFIGKNYFCPGNDYGPAPDTVKTFMNAKTSAAKIAYALERMAGPTVPRCNKIGSTRMAATFPARRPIVCTK